MSRLSLFCKVDLDRTKQFHRGGENVRIQLGCSQELECKDFLQHAAGGRKECFKLEMSETDFSPYLSPSTLFSCISSFLTAPQLSYCECISYVCAYMKLKISALQTILSASCSFLLLELTLTSIQEFFILY